ncbi:MAG: ABC transporter substrate-binding protein [Thermoleophilia bacterium]
MRIVSLLPAATEIVAAIGLGDRLVGRTHECDWPPAAGAVPAVTRNLLACDPADGAAIDRAVARAAGGGEPLYRLDERALATARPDLVIAQELCGVCAVGGEEAEAAARALPGSPAVVSLDPRSLDGVLEAMLAVGEAAGAPSTARRVVAGLRGRIDRVRDLVAGRPVRRVVCLEWLDPPFAAGHWVPDQVAAAGGVDLLGRPGGRSERLRDEDVVAADPRALLLMPCGWDVGRAVAAARDAGVARRYAGTRAVARGRVVALDGGAHFSRPGPRLVEGVEALARVLHPDVAGPPRAGEAMTVTAAVLAPAMSARGRAG